MTQEIFHNYCLSKPGVTADYPFKGECVWLKVVGKMFALSNVESMTIDGQSIDPFHFINLKCDPEKAIELRATHSAITPGWHQSKVHWNTLYMDGSLEDDLIRSLIDHSYEIVVKSLTKKQQESLQS